MVIQKIFPTVMLGIFFISCTNPFSTRSAEKPQADKNTDIFDQPTRSEVVLSNLRYALNEKNLSNYMSCFIDTSFSQSFTFCFKPDESIPSERFQGWSIQDEENYLRNVFNNAQNISFEFLDKENITFTPISTAIDSVQTSPFAYELKVEFKEPVTYSGIARMKLIKNSNSLWAIYYWEDTRNAENYSNTWSVLKADYRIN
jgi:hypothetical protein